MVATYGMRVVGAILILAIGRLVAKRVQRIIKSLMEKRFDSEGITIPFPQHDVHLIKDDA